MRLEQTAEEQKKAKAAADEARQASAIALERAAVGNGKVDRTGLSM